MGLKSIGLELLSYNNCNWKLERMRAKVSKQDIPGITKLQIICQLRHTGQQRDEVHTFSMPKNLSLPSGRIGPALFSIFSSGVGSGMPSGFLLTEVFMLGPVMPFRIRPSQPYIQIYQLDYS